MLSCSSFPSLVHHTPPSSLHPILFHPRSVRTLHFVIDTACFSWLLRFSLRLPFSQKQLPTCHSHSLISFRILLKRHLVREDSKTALCKTAPLSLSAPFTNPLFFNTSKHCCLIHTYLSFGILSLRCQESRHFVWLTAVSTRPTAVLGSVNIS